MSDTWKQIFLSLAAFVCGGGGLALIEWAREKWKFKAERKAVKEDRQEKKADEVEDLTKQVEALTKTVGDLTAVVSALKDAQKCVLLDRIIYLGQNYIKAGEIDFDDRRRLREMWNSYHNGLGGNGDADAIMHQIDALPLKN